MISVVIPAYNEEKNIVKTLESLAAQKTDKEYEIIVIDNNSTDNTSSVANSFKDKLNINVVKETKKGRSPARATGFEAAKGDIILSTDADTTLPENWIEKITSYFKDEKIAAVTGTCKIDDCGWFRNTLFNIIQPASMILYNIFLRHYWLSGFSFAIRKNVYEKAGGFDKFLNMQEDTELSFRVREIGKIKFMSDLPVIFSGRRFKKGLIRGLTPYATSYIKYYVAKKDPFLSDIR